LVSKSQLSALHVPGPLLETQGNKCT
jgi:hypothetical protein